MREYFDSNMVFVFFVYGLGFFSLGLAILLELGRPCWNNAENDTEFAQALPPLAAFGLIHGLHEWFEMFLAMGDGDSLAKAATEPSWISFIRLTLLVTSFLCLLGFGLQVSAITTRKSLLIVLASALSLWLIGIGLINQWSVESLAGFQAADVFTRYSLAIPSACLAAYGLSKQRKHFKSPETKIYGRDALIAAAAFLVYGLVGQLFTSTSNAAPCFLLSAECFLSVMGFPVQVLRAVLSVIVAIFVIRMLRIFQYEKQLQIKALSQAQEAEQKRFQQMRGELLHRTVKAQEAERQRIARELHDETGQTLTAIGMGLRALKQNIEKNPLRAAEQVEKLEALTNGGVEELQRLVAGLHPATLDDLGLLPALRWLATNLKSHTSLNIEVTNKGYTNNLAMEKRITLYRIAQEALANVIRHADANHATIELRQNSDRIEMTIRDDGRGFDPEDAFEPNNPTPSWGLLGMQERAALIGAVMEIISAPGEGTIIKISVPHSHQGE
jgi:signal transduction histidine kinase